MSSQKALFLYHEIYFVAIGLWLYKPVRFSEAHHLRQCIFTVCVCVSSCASFDSSVVLYIAMIAGLKLLELSLLNSLCFLISSLAHLSVCLEKLQYIQKPASINIIALCIVVQTMCK